MGKYVSVNKIGNHYIIRIEKMPNSYSGYKIFFEGEWGCCNFLSHENLAEENAILTSSVAQDIKAGSVYKIFFNEINSKLVKASHTITLNDTPWVREHIGDIKKQLLEQEAKKLQLAQKRDYDQAIETAIASDNPTSLIIRMIKENADKLNPGNVLEIERALMPIKTRLVNENKRDTDKTV